MTENKPIIIDGVDVSECPYDYTVAHCVYLKELEQVKEQLTRKTQECETLSSQLDFEVQKKECLEHESEKLKQKLKRIRDIFDFIDPSYVWYNGREKSNKSYPLEKWEKVLEKYNNSHSCCIKYNKNYNYEQAILFDELIRQSVLKD